LVGLIYLWLAGLREVKTACCGSGRFNGEVECSVDTNLCADRDEYLFWDTVHGTQAAYRRAVRAFFYGTTREAEPINLHQLLQVPSTPPPRDLQALAVQPATATSQAATKLDLPAT